MGGGAEGWGQRVQGRCGSSFDGEGGMGSREDFEDGREGGGSEDLRGGW